eukprot:1461343-Amphidinium_carterae.1
MSHTHLHSFEALLQTGAGFLGDTSAWPSAAGGGCRLSQRGESRTHRTAQIFKTVQIGRKPCRLTLVHNPRKQFRPPIPRASVYTKILEK